VIIETFATKYLGNVLSEDPPKDGQMGDFRRDVTILYASCQRVRSRTDKMSAGNSRAVYMRQYKKRKRLEEDNCNNVPKRTKLHAERQHFQGSDEGKIFNQ
jgi:hypothetical protein